MKRYLLICTTLSLLTSPIFTLAEQNGPADSTTNLLTVPKPAHLSQILSRGLITNIYCKKGLISSSNCYPNVSTAHCPHDYQPVAVLALADNQYSHLSFNGYKIDSPIPTDNMKGGYYLHFENAYANFSEVLGYATSDQPISLSYTILCN